MRSKQQVRVLCAITAIAVWQLLAWSPYLAPGLALRHFGFWVLRFVLLLAASVWEVYALHLAIRGLLPHGLRGQAGSIVASIVIAVGTAIAFRWLDLTITPDLW